METTHDISTDQNDLECFPGINFKNTLPPIPMKRVCVSDMAVYSLVIVNCFLKHLCLTDEIMINVISLL